MPLSTVKRESLIPGLHLLSIALLLTIAFVALIPSSDTFTYTADNTPGDKGIDSLDIAYLKARDASGDLSEEEMLSVIHNMIRSKKWQQARTLMAQRPDIVLDPRDQFLLNMETASAGFYGAENEGRSASYKAELISLMHGLYDTPGLHDEGTLTRAAEFSADLQQPDLSSSYYRLMAETFPDEAADHYGSCGRVLQRFGKYGEAAACYQDAVASADDPVQRNRLYLRLGQLHHANDKRLAAKSTLEQMIAEVPRHQRSLEKTAAFALETERPDLAYPLYARLADVDGGRAVYWLEKATLWAEAANQPGQAAEYVLSIRDLSDEEFKPELNRRRQALLIAAGRNEEALATMYERIVANPDSGEELIEGIKLARSMGLTQQALEWNEELLRIRPFDIEAMVRQIDFEVASNRLEDALAWNRKVLEQEPSNEEYVLRLAQLEEWTGDPEAAMKARQWLAANHPSAANDRELLRLAELNWDAKTAAETLHKIARATPLTTEELLKLVRLYEQDGRPDLAAGALEEMLGGDNDAMILRELAALHLHHVKYEEALATWDQFASRFGRSAEETLHRMELLWRLERPDEAVALADQINQFNSNGASQYQLALMTELGWRYRKPELIYAAAPYLDKLDSKTFGSTNGRRIVQSLIDNKDYSQAVVTAENMWRETDDISFLLSAIHIALRENIYPHYERFLDADGDLLKVREIPEYWLTIADYHNRNSDTEAALETYRNTLAMQPDNSNALEGLIWTMLGNDTDKTILTETLNQYKDVATEIPSLWHPYAVGYLSADDPQTSLRWFSKIMAQGDNDYNVLLSFADALERTDNNTHAFKVRRYAMQQLLPQVLAGTDGRIDDLSRDYISILRSYGSAAENEAWTQALLTGIEDVTPEESAWRRELAASWYLATQRSDYARLVMTKIHERRLESPAWQRLAVALNENNLPVVKDILADTDSELTTGDEILALRRLGHERQAFVLAKQTLTDVNNSANERDIAREHLMSIRGSRPGYYAGIASQTEIGNLNVTESGLSLRHTLTAADLGFEVDYRRNRLSSDVIAVANSDEDDLALSAHFGNSTRGGRLTAGVNANGVDDLNYTSGEYYIRDRSGKRELISALAFNEVAENSAEFRIGAKQNRAEVSFQSTIGKREFVRVSGNVNELATRASDEKIARGVGASIEVGTTGSIGTNNWRMGLVASGEVNELEPLSSFSGFLLNETQQIALNASWSRGSLRSDYPSIASPRYHVTARLGHSWPSDNTGVSLQAGAGFRVLGNDELSLQLEHSSDALEVFNTTTESLSTFGIQYTNHF